MPAYLSQAKRTAIIDKVRGAQNRDNLDLLIDEVAAALAADLAAGSVVAPADHIASIGVTTNLTAVPASFADLAAVRTYLAGANMVPMIETRLDNVEAKIDALLVALETCSVIKSS